MKNIHNENIKCLGVDWGEKRIGLALGDSETGLATPYKTVNSGKEVLDVVLEEGIDEVIVGKPLPMNNGKGIMNNDYMNFIEDLKDDLVIPVILVDERLSSKAADALVGNNKTKAGRDEIAAMLILQTYLDAKRTK